MSSFQVIETKKAEIALSKAMRKRLQRCLKNQNQTFHIASNIGIFTFNDDFRKRVLAVIIEMVDQEISIQETELGKMEE